MTGWYKITKTTEADGNLGSVQLRVLNELKPLFLALAAAKNEDMAVFSTLNPREYVEFYVSPQCFPELGSFVRGYGGQPSEPPALNDDLALLTSFAPNGDDPWDFHLGGHPPRPGRLPSE